MDEKILKNLIKIPKNLDNAISKGLEKGINEKKRKNSNKRLKRCSLIAGLVIGVTVGAGIIKPDLVSAIPGAKNIFKSFNTTLFGEPTTKFEKAATSIGTPKVSNNSTITLDEAILDDNILMLGLTVESNFLKNYNGKNEIDFFNLDLSVYIDNKPLPSWNTRAVRKIDENKGAYILESNIANLNIKNKSNIKLYIKSITRGTKTLKGKWNFDINIKKQQHVKRIKLNKKINYKKSTLKADELIMSNLTNTLILKGKDNYKSPILQNFTNYIIRDDNGKYFKSEFKSSDMDTFGNFNLVEEIKGDLTNSKYIELTSIDDICLNETIKGLKYPVLKCTGSKDAKYQKQIISKNPTKQELKDGYGLDTVYHCLLIDKQRQFKSLKDLVGSEIKVNNTENVIIKDINLTKDGTKIIFESKGIYDYRNLSQMVILDEKMNSLNLREGQNGAVIEDDLKGLFSVTLDKLNPNKKYKIAIPIIKEISTIKSKWNMIIKLK